MTESSRPQRGHWIFAAVYRRLCDATDRAGFAKVRASLLADAAGDVLELGAGTGGNLPHYVNAQRVFLVEPDPAMRKTLAGRVARAPVPAEIASGSAERTPYADGRFDTVVATLVFCTVDDLDRSVAEARRVLKPGGSLLFLEHVGASDPKSKRTQERIEPLWKRLSGGCHLTRDPVAALERAGFSEITVEPVRFGRGVGPAKPIVRGIARA